MPLVSTLWRSILVRTSDAAERQRVGSTATASTRGKGRAFAGQFRVATVSALLVGLSVANNVWAREHLVLTGESLWSLAHKYGVSVEALAAANHLGKDASLRAGKKLVVPGGSQELRPIREVPAPKKAGEKATVSQGASPGSAKAVSKPVTPKTEPGAQAPAGATAKPAAEVPLSKAISVAPLLPGPTPKDPAPKEPALSKLSAKVRDQAEVLYQDPSGSRSSNTLDEVAPDWVLATPSDANQRSKSLADRGGIHPCSTKDIGFAGYGKWVQISPLAHLLTPSQMSVPNDGSFSLVVHFHGREPLRKEWVRVMQRTVLVAIDVGIDSESYRVAFKDPRSLSRIVAAAEQEVARLSGNPAAHARQIGLSAWSAGYGAIESVLAGSGLDKRVDSLVLLDGLHAGYSAHSLSAERLAPFVDFARAAANSEKLMFVSHSSLRTSGYASTTETANYLAWRLDGRPQISAAPGNYPLGLERISTFSRGNFMLRGFAGGTAADHCAQIGLMRDVLKVHLKPRYEAPPSPAAPALPSPNGAPETPRGVPAPSEVASLSREGRGF